MHHKLPWQKHLAKIVINRWHRTPIMTTHATVDLQDKT